MRLDRILFYVSEIGYFFVYSIHFINEIDIAFVYLENDHFMIETNNSHREEVTSTHSRDKKSICSCHQHGDGTGDKIENTEFIKYKN